MKVALDTNILVYGEGYRDEGKTKEVERLLIALAGRIVLPTQVLGELFDVLASKAGRSRRETLDAVARWSAVAEVVAGDVAQFEAATQLAADHGLQIWDAFILVTAADSGCPILISEDRQDGFRWRRITVVNPFQVERHPHLVAALTFGS